LTKALGDPDHVLYEMPVTAGVVESMHLVHRNAVPDMLDRIIAATGIHLGLPCHQPTE
jgi:hypothetical protein